MGVDMFTKAISGFAANMITSSSHIGQYSAVQEILCSYRSTVEYAALVGSCYLTPPAPTNNILVTYSALQVTTITERGVVRSHELFKF